MTLHILACTEVKWQKFQHMPSLWVLFLRVFQFTVSSSHIYTRCCFDMIIFLFSVEIGLLPTIADLKAHSCSDGESLPPKKTSSWSTHFKVHGTLFCSLTRRLTQLLILPAVLWWGRMLKSLRVYLTLNEATLWLHDFRLATWRDVTFRCSMTSLIFAGEHFRPFSMSRTTLSLHFNRRRRILRWYLATVIVLGDRVFFVPLPLNS